MGFRGGGVRFLYFERTRPTTCTRQPCLMYLSTSTGARTGCHYLLGLSVCVCVRVCVTFVVFIDCESCTTSTSTNPGSMEAGKYGLMRGTCFVSHRLEVVAVAGLLWLSWCVLGGADFLVLCFSIFIFFKRKRPAASMRPPCPFYLYTSNGARPKKQSDRGRFLPLG